MASKKPTRKVLCLLNFLFIPSLSRKFRTYIIFMSHIKTGIILLGLGRIKNKADEHPVESGEKNPGRKLKAKAKHKCKLIGMFYRHTDTNRQTHRHTDNLLHYFIHIFKIFYHYTIREDTH